MAKKKQLPEEVAHSEAYVKDFFDMAVPSAMFACRVKNANDQSFATLNRLEKQINDQGFDCRRATKDDIKRILSRYFGHMTEDAIDDVDGERMIKKWIIPD